MAHLPTSTTRNSSVTCRPQSWSDAVRTEAYLLTLAEARADTPVYGHAWFQDVVTAFTAAPKQLRAFIPAPLRHRYDWWVTELSAEQLDLFHHEDT